jgi:hypothetical protein
MLVINAVSICSMHRGRELETNRQLLFLVDRPYGRQTLRRLPRSGAILFTIRTYFEPMTKLAQEPYILVDGEVFSVGGGPCW